MDFKFFYNIQEHLLEKLGGGHEPNFLSDIKNKTLDQILDKMRAAPDPDLRGLLATYALEALNSLEPDEIKTKQLIEVHGIIETRADLQESSYYQLDSIVRKYIMETKTLPQLFSLSSMAIKIKKFNDICKESYVCIENQFVSLLYDYMNDIYTNHSEKSALEGAKYLKTFIKRGFDIAMVVDVFYDPIITFIRERNQILYENDYNIPVNVENDLKIIDYMMRCKLSVGNINDLKSCEEILLLRGKRAIKKKDKIEEFEEREIKEKLNENFLRITEEISRANKEDITVIFTNATYKNEPVILKEYIKSPNDSLNQKISEKFNMEVKCYEYLHKNYNNGPLPSKFLKFYGCSPINQSFKLAYENFGGHLGTYIKAMKDMKRSIKRKELWEIIKELIDAFVEMENHNIYHQNISLYSIRINNTLNIKILDFNYGLVGEDLCSSNFQSKDEFRKVHYWPKMVEKSEGKLGKQDVFALGLVILQLCTLEIINEPSDEQFLENAIKKVGDIEMANLLRSMLTFECSERMRFKNLEVAYFGEGSTVSRMSSHMGSILRSDID